MLQEMVRANCKMIYFGIENGTQKVLDYYNKQTTPKQALDAVKRARNVGVDVIVASFIVGAPHETRKEIWNTLKFAQKLQVDIPQFNILATFPGTDIWEELKMQNLIDEDKYWETGVMVSEVSPDTVPTKEIENMIHEAYNNFFIRPSYILKQLAKIARSSYRRNVLINNLKRAETVVEGVKMVT
jgi:anaerobic magnesium-protoporphyrin IX monomethyl ester cyclase